MLHVYTTTLVSMHAYACLDMNACMFWRFPSSHPPHLPRLSLQQRPGAGSVRQPGAMSQLLASEGPRRGGRPGGGPGAGRPPRPDALATRPNDPEDCSIDPAAAPPELREVLSRSPAELVLGEFGLSLRMATGRGDETVDLDVGAAPFRCPACELRPAATALPSLLLLPACCSLAMQGRHLEGKASYCQPGCSAAGPAGARVHGRPWRGATPAAAALPVPLAPTQAPALAPGVACRIW